MPVDQEYARLRDEWARHIETHSVSLTGGAHKTTCPLCKEDHFVCRFGTGALGCINVDCDNPHHGRPVENIPPF